MNIFKIGLIIVPMLFCQLVLAAGTTRPAETVTPNFQHTIPNIPGKSLISVVVTYPPNGASSSHRHAKSAFIYAYVLEGEIRSSVDGSSPKIYHAGQSWYEAPGAHHTISENASASTPARLLAVFVVDDDDKGLTIPDPQ